MDARGLRLEIASPCPVAWEAMRGDQRVRFCGSCRQNVYNIEALTQDEAERLITQREGRTCMRILRRQDGTVLTRDCWSRLKAARRRGTVHLVFMMIAVGWAQLAAMRSGLAQLRSLWRPRACSIWTAETRGQLVGMGIVRRDRSAAAPVEPEPPYDPSAHDYPILVGDVPRRSPVKPAVSRSR